MAKDKTTKPKAPRVSRGKTTQVNSGLMEQNKILAREINEWMSRALLAEGYLEQAIDMIKWAKQFAPTFEVRNNFNQAISVLTGIEQEPDEKPAEIVNERIILQ